MEKETEMGAADMKAMREALEDARNYLLKHCGSSEAHAIARRIGHSLSGPPRNCDLFDTKDKAREAFQKLRGHCVFADVSLWDNRDEIEAFLDWVFATKKGETNGSK